MNQNNLSPTEVNDDGMDEKITQTIGRDKDIFCESHHIYKNVHVEYACTYIFQ